MLVILSRLNDIFRLSFQDKEVEKKYQEQYFKEHLEQNVLAAKIAILLYFVYAPLTYFIIGDEVPLLLSVVSFSISGLLFLIIVHKRELFIKYRYFILYIVAVIAALGPIVFYSFTHHEKTIFQVDIIIPIIAIFTMYGIGFSLALLVFFTITFLFFILAYFVSMPIMDLFIALYATLFGVLISAVSGYLIEKTNRKLFLAKIKSDEFKFIIENSHDAIAIFDKETRSFLYANQIALKRNGNKLEEIVGKHVFDIHKHLDDKVIDSIVKKLDRDGIFSDVLHLQNAKGEFYYVHSVIQYGYYNSKKVIISVSSDVTELKKAELRIREMAFKDPLTKLFNRYKLDEYSILEYKRFQRERHDVALIICDIDHFKSVNDTYGHLVGDHILQKIAQLLQESVRETDIVARWGGEEFALLLLNTDKDEAIRVAEKLNEAVASIFHEGVGKVSISCGVSELRDGDTQISWFSRVDDALYKAKESGRDRVVYK